MRPWESVRPPKSRPAARAGHGGRNGRSRKRLDTGGELRPGGAGGDARLGAVVADAARTAAPGGIRSCFGRTARRRGRGSPGWRVRCACSDYPGRVLPRGEDGCEGLAVQRFVNLWRVTVPCSMVHATLGIRAAAEKPAGGAGGSRGKERSEPEAPRYGW